MDSFIIGASVATPCVFMALVLRRGMASDLESALAFVARRQGRTSMAGGDWRHVLSLELGWFTPAQAARAVEAAEALGLLRRDGEALRFTLDAATVEVPRGFRPDPAAIPDATPPTSPNDPFVALLDRIAAHRKVKRSQIMESVAQMQGRFGGRLEAEAAALRVAVEAGLDVQPEARAALARVMGAAAER